MHFSVIAGVFFLTFACGTIEEISSDSGVSNQADAKPMEGVGMEIADGDLGGDCFPNMTCNSNLVCNETDKRCEAPAVCENSYIIYLNKNGGTFSSGSADDPLNNVTIIAMDGDSTVLAPMTGTMSSWTKVMNTVTSAFSDFDVFITDVEPTVPHIEIVITSSDSKIMNSNFVNSLSVSSTSCLAKEESFGFVFARTGQNADTISNIVAGSAAVALGLEYVHDCGDIMSSKFDCEPLALKFANKAMKCGNWNAESACRCDSSVKQQNSFKRLKAKVGLNTCN